MTTLGERAPAQAAPAARGRRLSRRLAGLMLLLAVGAPLGGVAYAVNGATHAKAEVRVTVVIRELDRLSVPVADHAISEARARGVVPSGHEKEFALRQYADDPGSEGRTVRLDLPGEHGATWLDADMSTVTLASWDSTMAEQLLARGGTAVTALCIGVGALLLYRILLSIDAGRPFEAGNPRRLAGLAGAVAVAGAVPGFLSAAAADLVLHRVDLAGPDSPVMSPPVVSIGALAGNLLVAFLVLALAEVFRRGAESAQSVGRVG
ncbi:DUF2975 domain-containing protein [Streptomyces sp. NPDC060027]|uniref:DUF2975 domain-containing protein n=1 Tax=Streptomyces sp. NPDC060027 TaxID=3347040 RepID=UPI00368F7BAA